MRVAVFGMGHVGLVTAVMLAQYGHEVIGVEVDADRLAMLRAGTVPFREPSLSGLLAHAVHQGRLRFTEDGAAAAAACDMSLVCVGTPTLRDGTVDLSAVYQVLDVIAEGARCGDLAGRRTDVHVVVLRSTVPPAMIASLTPHLDRLKVGDVPIGFCTNPEFLREGSAVSDFINPPFVVIGRDDDATGQRVAALYDALKATVLMMDTKTAMLLKYVSNAWHALKVAFANEVGDIAAQLGVNGGTLMAAFTQDTALNISSAYLRPGEPYGGSCLPKDLRALMSMTLANTPVLSAIAESNGHRISRIVMKAKLTCGPRIGVVGLSFKPGTDDLRDSPWAAVVDALLDDGACDVRVYDPDVPAEAAWPYSPYLWHRDHFDELAQWSTGMVIGKPEVVPADAQLPVHVIYGDGR